MTYNKKKLLLAFLTGTVITASTCSLVGPHYYHRINSFYNVSYESVFPFTSDTVDYSTLRIPIVGNMVPQGLSIASNNIFISAYDYKKVNNSCIYVLDNYGDLINTCYLDIKSHVGGISYDKTNSLLWVTGNDGCVVFYDIEDILCRNSAKMVNKPYYIGEGCSDYLVPWKEAIAYMTIYSNHLFVGSFSLSSPGLIKEYKYTIDDNGCVSFELLRSFKCPTKVQGIDFYRKNDKEYILFSRSFGKSNSSLLQIFAYDEVIDDYSDSELKSVNYEMPAMMEQITVADDVLYSLYESASKPYVDGAKETTDHVLVSKLEYLLK